MPEGPLVDDIKKYPENRYIFHFEGYTCTAKRMDGWNWNGYIELPLDHPDVGKDYNDVADVNVHGGLTYSKENIFGFDTCHALDLVPGHIVLYHIHPIWKGGSYKTLEFVREELRELAHQFKEKKKKKEV